MAAVGAVIGIVSLLANEYEKSQAADREAKFIAEEKQIQEERNARIQEQTNQNILNMSSAENSIDVENAETIFAQQGAMLNQRALVIEAAGIAGTGGGDVQTALNDINATFGRNLNIINDNTNIALDDISFQKESAQRNADLAKTYKSFYEPAGYNASIGAIKAISGGLEGYSSGLRFQKSFKASRTANQTTTG